jgi:hypothetical protein
MDALMSGAGVDLTSLRVWSSERGVPAGSLVLPLA